jgi:PadR family transcriptional regulator, regulatory protein AphA
MAARLTSTSYVVLGLLDVFGDSTPYDLKRALERSVQNFWPVPHATFYAEPDRLAGAGYLTVEQEAGGRRRKVYSLTDKGREALREWAETPTAAPPQLHDEGVLKIFVGADPEPILADRAEWHRTKLVELAGYLDAVREAGGPASVEQSLLAGIAYHRALLDALERYLQSGRPEA